jgi:hypothetical protein
MTRRALTDPSLTDAERFELSADQAFAYADRADRMAAAGAGFAIVANLALAAVFAGENHWRTAIAMDRSPEPMALEAVATGRALLRSSRL